MLMWTTTHCFDFFAYNLMLSQCKITDPHMNKPTFYETSCKNTFFSHITCTGGGGGELLLLK